MKSFLLVTFLVFAFCVVNAQRQGTLDSSFGENGKVVSILDRSYSTIAGLPQPGNKTLIVGGGMSLHRFNANGSIDTSFGIHGKVIVRFDELYNYYTVDGLLTKDGKILLIGWASFHGDTGYNFILARVTADGKVDSSFGDNGKVINKENPFAVMDRATSATLDNNGNIIITGYRDYYPQNGGKLTAFITKRYYPNGEWDQSFGESGVALTDFTNGDQGTSVVCQSDGKIVVGGVVRYYDFKEQHFGLVRYNSNGTIDESFGTNGKIETGFGTNGEVLNTLVLQPDGKILAGGVSNLNIGARSWNMAIARYNVNGSLDNLFGSQGKVTVSFGNKSGEVKALLLQNSGKILATGNSFNPYNPEADFALVRLQSNGIIDSAFGVNGITITDFGGNNESCRDAVIQSDGKIVLVGEYSLNRPPYYLFLLARYYGDPVKQQSPIVKKIKRWIRNHTLNWQYNADVDYFVIEQSSNGVNGFREIARIKSTGSNTYTYNLNNLLSNIKTYYRITAINTDGSKVVSTVISDEDVISITISPNPVKDILKISGLPVNQKTTISIINRNGNIIQSATCNSSVCMMNVAELKSGLYNVQFINKDKTQTLKFVKE